MPINPEAHVCPDKTIDTRVGYQKVFKKGYAILDPRLPYSKFGPTTASCDEKFSFVKNAPRIPSGPLSTSELGKSFVKFLGDWTNFIVLSVVAVLVFVGSVAYPSLMHRRTQKGRNLLPQHKLEPRKVEV